MHDEAAAARTGGTATFGTEPEELLKRVALISMAVATVISLVV